MTTTVQIIGERELMAKLKKLGDDLESDSVAMKAGFTRIARILEGQMKQNIEDRRPQLYDTGALINSITHRFLKNGVEVGSMRGVPYARLMEFGGVYSDKMRGAMFARLREEGKLGRTKGVMDSAARNLPARPFIGTALEIQRDRVTEILQQEVLRSV